MGRFETELLTQKDNLKGLEWLNVEWMNRAMVNTAHRCVILDIDSSESPVHVTKKVRLTTVTSSASAIIPCSASTSSETVKARCSDPATSTAPMGGRSSSSLLSSVT